MGSREPANRASKDDRASNTMTKEAVEVVEVDVSAGETTTSRSETETPPSSFVLAGP